MPAEATRFWYVPDAGGPRPRAVSHLGAPITKQPDPQDHSARPELTPVAGASASTRKQQNQMDLTRETPGVTSKSRSMERPQTPCVAVAAVRNWCLKNSGG